jgi:hypothetical protein
MTPSEFTEFAINLKGKPISLARRPWIKAIQDLPVTQKADGTFDRKSLLIFGRQCEKSTTLANSAIAYCNTVPYLRALYVTASDTQMREFSDERLRSIIADSPKLLELSGQAAKGSARSRVAQREVQNVQTKRWINQSKIVLRSAYQQGADRVRGISSDFLMIDEIQDQYVDNLPVIEETLFHSELEGGPISIYSGTPKTFDNPLEYYWSRFSTQNEWLIRCDRCRHWNCIDVDNLGPTGLCCVKCSKELDPVLGKAQWVRTGREDKEWQGFRLPQPIVVYAFKDKQEVFDRMWRELLNKKNRYSRGKLMNEVMARSYDSGTKPVTFDEVRRCSLPDIKLMRWEDVGADIRSTHTWGGVDYGTGDVSFTVCTIWRYDSLGRFLPIWIKKYEGIEADPDYSLEDIIKTFRHFNVRRIGADWGFGFHANPKLQKAFGAQRVFLYQHTGSQSQKVAWDKMAMLFKTHRTRVLQDLFDLIKRGPVSGGIAFPSWDEFEKYANDILAVYQEEGEREIKFDHPRGSPDDFLHSLCFAFLTSQLDHPRPDLQSPGAR